MQYHAASLAAAGSDVDLIGLEGAAVMPALASDPRIHVHRLPDRAFAGRSKGGVRRFVLSSVARGIGQAVRLFATLMRIPKPDVILVQNPPAFPTLFVAWLASRLRGARFVIDWHNLSHTIAAVKVGERHRAVKAHRAQRAAMGEARGRAPDRVEGARGMAGARIQSEGRRSSTIGPATRSRVRRRPMRPRCGRGSPRTRSSAARGRRSSSVRRAGRPMRISICCSKRSSARNVS